MPPIFLHMVMARDMLAGIDHPALAARPGEYYFGATTPDIRVLTRQPRSRTHYYDLDVYEHQDSVAAFLADRPELADADRLSAELIAFVAGYISHLQLDQCYIDDIFRPHFGQLSALGGDSQAHLMDRLLQFELDRRRREEPETATQIREALEACNPALDIGFLDSDTLRRWLQVAVDQTRHPPDWRRFRQQGGRHVPGLDLESDAALDAFLERIPGLLEATIRHVSTAHVDAYVEQSTERAAGQIRRFLGAP